MIEKKQNRNALRSKRLIRQAFTQLLMENDFEDITVKAIAEKADINRTTFYCHYQDIYDLVDEMIQEAVDRHMEAVAQNPYRNIMKNPMPYLQMLKDLIEENLILYKALSQTDYAKNQLDQLLNRLLEDVFSSPDIPESIRSSISFHIHIHLYLGGCMNTLQKWMEGLIPCDLDEIIRIISDTVAIAYEKYYR